MNKHKEMNKYIDNKGVEWQRYSVFFKPFYTDNEFAFEIWATSYEDAEDRLTAIKNNAHIGGKIEVEIPVDISRFNKEGGNA